jgi:tetratricopeptide (TPR) repeat protein
LLSSWAVHPDAAQSLNNLAIVYDAQARYQEAEVLYQQAFAIYEQSVGAETIHNLYPSCQNGIIRLQSKY